MSLGKCQFCFPVITWQQWHYSNAYAVACFHLLPPEFFLTAAQTRCHTLSNKCQIIHSMKRIVELLIETKHLNLNALS